MNNRKAASQFAVSVYWINEFSL